MIPRSRDRARFLERHRADGAKKRDRYRAAFSAADRSIRLLPVACFLPLHRISQSHFPADGLRVPEVRAFASSASTLRSENFPHINAIVIIFLVPIVGALTQKFAAYRMVIIGGVICAAGVFIMALPTEWFLPAAESVIGQWLGHGYLGVHGSIHPYYIMTALYLIVFSVGEAFYSPRVYEYAAAIAPKGQEASYGSLAYLPFLVGKILVGAGGWLLAAFCPGTRSATLRDNVAYLCSGGVGRADRIDCAASLHSRSRSRVGPINRKNGLRQIRNPQPFSSLVCE